MTPTPPTRGSLERSRRPHAPRHGHQLSQLSVLPTHWILPFILLLASCSTPQRSLVATAHAHPLAAASIDALRWLAGTWRTERGNSVSEERWDLPHEGAMRGLGRTTESSRVVDHELLRLVERERRLVYVAAPQGQAVTEFVLTVSEPSHARFENPAHDFPQWIDYRRDGSTLTARVGGASTQRTASWTFQLASEPRTSTPTRARVCRDAEHPGYVDVTIPPCTCGAFVVCAEMADARGESFALAVIDNACDACMPSRGHCRAPAAAERGSRSGDGCVEESVVAVVGM